MEKEFLKGYRTFIVWSVGTIILTVFTILLIFFRTDTDIKSILDLWTWFYIANSSVILLKNGAQSIIDMKKQTISTNIIEETNNVKN